MIQIDLDKSGSNPKHQLKIYTLTGQDILTVGLAGALGSGVLTTSVVLGKNMFKDL